MLRDPLLTDVTVPGTGAQQDRDEGVPWGGLPGALVFYQGTAIGVVIEHQPRQGRSAITIMPVERFAAVPAWGDPGRATVAEALGLPPPDKLPLTGGPPLADLVDVLVGGQLPRVAGLDPYTLGATPSAYGKAETYGQRDEYVDREIDESLAEALRPERLVILVGPSKAGKSRTPFETLLRHDDWRNALLAAPRHNPSASWPGIPCSAAPARW